MGLISSGGGCVISFLFHWEELGAQGDGEVGGSEVGREGVEECNAWCLGAGDSEQRELARSNRPRLQIRREEKHSRRGCGKAGKAPRYSKCHR